MNIVSPRYADTPTFLPVTQVIAGYSMGGSASALMSWNTFNSDKSGQFGGNVSYSGNPTFTMTPTTGEAFAKTYIRPLSPSLVLPPAQSGILIDLLPRILGQSIGDLQNSAALGGPLNSGSTGFFALIQARRRLQLNGALRIRFANAGMGDQVFIALDPEDLKIPQVASDVRAVRSLLNLKDDQKEFEVMYGSRAIEGQRTGATTRSVMGLMTEIGAQINVPDEDIRARSTVPTVDIIGGETRPTIVVKFGKSITDDAYASVTYVDMAYWIDFADFDSKFAFSVVQTLIALAQAPQNISTPIVTIPANRAAPACAVATMPARIRTAGTATALLRDTRLNPFPAAADTARWRRASHRGCSRSATQACHRPIARSASRWPGNTAWRCAPPNRACRLPSIHRAGQ